MSGYKTDPNQISGVVDDIYRGAGYGSRNEIFRESSSGFNIVSTGQMTTPSRATYGMVFFTRPKLNLTYDNLSKDVRFLPWRDSPEWSIARMTRCFLDPLNQVPHREAVVKSNGKYQPNTGDNRGVTCPLVDINNPFIPFLSNRLLSISGWPDTRLDYFASDKGIRGEQWIMADGVAEIYGAYSLDCSFNNDAGDGVLMLADLWTKYQSALLHSLDPYPEMLARRETDYMTRITSLVLDETRTYILHWACTGAAFPTNSSDGAIHNHDADKYEKDALKTVSVQFQCVGAIYNDIRYLHAFNKLVGTFNRELAFDPADPKSYTPDGTSIVPNGNRGGVERWIKLLPSERQLLNFYATPLINTITKELEWWVRRDVYIDKMLARVDLMPESSLESLKRGGVNKPLHRGGVLPHPSGLTPDEIRQKAKFLNVGEDTSINEDGYE